MARPAAAAAAVLLALLGAAATPGSALAAPAVPGPRLSEAQLPALAPAVEAYQQEQELGRPMLRATRPPYKEPPVWPEQLHAVLKQNRDGALADVDLYYDYPNGRNLNIIRSLDTGDVLYDSEWNNHTSFYYHPEAAEPTCSMVTFPVGILKPDWLKGARYKGLEEVNGHQCDVWAQPTSIHPKGFVTYYADVETQEPVRWVFFDGGLFDVQQWIPGGTLPDEQWQVPAYCFDQDEDADDGDDNNDDEQPEEEPEEEEDEVAMSW